MNNYNHIAFIHRYKQCMCCIISDNYAVFDGFPREGR